MLWLTWTLIENCPFLFRNISPISPPGFFINMCVPSTQAATLGKFAIRKNFLILFCCSIKLFGNLIIFPNCSANAIETLLIIKDVEAWETPRRSPATV